MKYKAIRSAAHNFGASFVSTLNWAGDDYTMSHLVRRAVSSGEMEFTVDLLTGRAGPQALLGTPVAAAVAHYVHLFRSTLAAQRVETAHLASARMDIRFLLKGTVAAQGRRPPWTVPFVCVVSVVDDRGRQHEGRVEDMWHVHNDVALASR